MSFSAKSSDFGKFHSKNMPSKSYSATTWYGSSTLDLLTSSSRSSSSWESWLSMYLDSRSTCSFGITWVRPRIEGSAPDWLRGELKFSKSSFCLLFSFLSPLSIVLIMWDPIFYWLPTKISNISGSWFRRTFQYCSTQSQFLRWNRFFFENFRSYLNKMSFFGNGSRFSNKRM